MIRIALAVEQGNPFAIFLLCLLVGAPLASIIIFIIADIIFHD